MSRKTCTNKKRRLESEQSQTSGITLLSNATQTTQLSSDFEDNASDSSSNNGHRGSFSNVNDGVQSQANNLSERNLKRAQRKRQVSWSLDYEGDDETFLKERSNGFTSPTSTTVPYDNNFNGTNNSRRRTRRATESSLDTHTLSYFQPQYPVRSPGGQNDQWASPLRSNTTSQIHGHENDIERKRIMAQLVREHDAKMIHERRTQSATSLRDPNLRVGPICADTHFQPVNHMYESLQNRVPMGPTRPVETVVTIPNGGPNYIQPVTQVQRGNRSDSLDMLNNITRIPRNDDLSNNGDSSYADVQRYSESSTTSQGKCLHCRGCSSTFFRKGFFVLLVLNVIFVLLNVVGLPFLYVAMKQDTPPVAIQTSNICVKCDTLTTGDREEFETPGEENHCCGSAEKIFPALLRAAEQRLSAIIPSLAPDSDKTAAKVPVVQLKASTKNKRNEDGSKIIWIERADINTMSAEIVDDGTSIKVPKNGYYYMYSRVHYEKSNKSDSSEFTIGHKLMRQERLTGIAKPLDQVVQRCFPSKNTGDVRHTNHIGSIQYLQKDDIVFIQLDHKKYFDHSNTMFGMFLVAT